MRPLIKVFIAEDVKLHMEGTISLINQMGDCTIVGTATDGSKASQSILELCEDDNTKPDIALLDINMPGKSGLEVAKEIMPKGVKVILFTGYSGMDNILAADKLRVRGFLRKEAPFDEFENALRTVYRGQSYMDSMLIEPKEEVLLNPELNDPLTDNERTALILYMQGCSVKESAEKMNVSERSVQGYRSSLLDRLKGGDSKEKPNMIKVFKWAKSLGFISEKDIYE